MTVAGMARDISLASSRGLSTLLAKQRKCVASTMVGLVCALICHRLVKYGMQPLCVQRRYACFWDSRLHSITQLTLLRAYASLGSGWRLIDSWRLLCITGDCVARVAGQPEGGDRCLRFWCERPASTCRCSGCREMRREIIRAVGHLWCTRPQKLQSSSRPRPVVVHAHAQACACLRGRQPIPRIGSTLAMPCSNAV